MNRHLSSSEVVEALEATLAPARGRHLEACDACRQQVAEFQRTVESLDVSAVPEPASLFWEQFPSRVRRETAGLSAEADRWRWWGWRSISVLVPAAVAVMVVVTVGRVPSLPGPVPAAPLRMPATAVARGAVDESVFEGPAVTGGQPTAWSEIVELVAAVPMDQLQAVAPIRQGSADALIEDLTRAERAELMRLLRAEMGSGA